MDLPTIFQYAINNDRISLADAVMTEPDFDLSMGLELAAAKGHDVIIARLLERGATWSRMDIEQEAHVRNTLGNVASRLAALMESGPSASKALLQMASWDGLDAIRKRLRQDAINLKRPDACSSASLLLAADNALMNMNKMIISGLNQPDDAAILHMVAKAHEAIVALLESLPNQAPQTEPA